MPIEVTSIRDQRRVPSLRRAAQTFRDFIRDDATSKRRVLLRSLLNLIAIALLAGGNSLVNSYKYHARLIDARLASGYLTSRPGVYAAPRIIERGQKLSHLDLVKALRRAGYVESAGSNVFSGSFRIAASAIEIRPTHTNDARPPIVSVSIDTHDKVSELISEGVRIDSFTLEPEVLSNDLSAKGGLREALAYDEIPPVLVHAILAIEDRRFFEHSGVDLFGIGRALLRNVGDERVGQGGSTITQQLVKNTYLTPERTLRRKYAEAMLAFALERRLSKQDIFALYCNEAYLGQRGAVAARGVKEAARIYFGKGLKDLSLAEAATIAGMIQGPSRYSPLRHNAAALARRNTVLDAMVRDGWIDAGRAELASSEPLVVSRAESSDIALAPYFVDQVNRIADSDFNVSPTSQRVYSTIDLDLQQLAEAALKKQLDRLDTAYKSRDTKPQAALVALDPRTGNVLAMVGGRDYAESQLNRATDARRQPGSTFKPFVYAAALEDGISPVQTFADAPREFVYDQKKVYRPANFGGGYSMGDVTLRTGLVKSLNVVTVDVALRTGLARIANLAQQFGLPRPERFPALALGTEEVTPLELAAAYAAFVNGGHRVKPRFVASVGEPPATHSASDNKDGLQVISPTTAYMITNMLSAVVDHGTGRAARGAVKGTAIAGKTGTSRDGWFVGYSPNLVCAVWIGFDDNQQLGLTGAEAALPAWTDFMNAAIEAKPALGGKNFECPEGIRFVEIDADDGLLSTLSCPHRELIAVTERLAPNLECLVHGNLTESLSESSLPRVDPGGPNDQVLLSQHSQPPARVERAASSIEAAPTWIDIDSNGRRRLANAMR
ncbi:MAG TPA: PBP1A family penicillin-binding protein [Pyrinomonadaceae bacterium]|nr:PBP1A family penicillin-binding protein [Pyrinomonadaceae bacterium]